MTLWSPDTCGCQITISDNPKTAGQPTAQPVKCQFHQNTDHNGVLAENQSKNLALTALATALPTFVDANGNSTCGWSMTGNDAARQVIITLPTGATALQQTQASTAVASLPNVSVSAIAVGQAQVA